ncbi:MAG: histidinol-phosphate transaminase [Gammaproteobacteria bacterium]|nr:histidinol-phosphate transaminase [Gammaproteobacteria bacterium]
MNTSRPAVGKYPVENDTVLEQTIARWVPESIRTLKAYHVPPADGLLKLDAMESPYELTDDMQQKWLNELGKVSVNRYPDPSCRVLKESMKKVFSIPESAGVMLGNGSDELIQIIVMLVAAPGRKILAPVPTFSMYEIISAAMGCDFIGVPLKPDFSLDTEKMLSEIRAHQPACVFLSYPNNPTGNCFDEAMIDEVIKSAPGLVVLDEAYFAFCQRSFMDKLDFYPNLVILRTMSKSGLAGLRLGMLMARPMWVEQLEKLRLPYNINILTQTSALFYLDNYRLLQSQSEQILQERVWLESKLRELTGLLVFKSNANFILVKVNDSSQFVFDQLMLEGVLIRNLHQSGTLLENCLRITVSTREQNLVFLDAFRRVLAAV